MRVAVPAEPVHTGEVDPLRRSLALVAWLLGLIAVLAMMAALGHGALAAPDLVAPGTWAGWLAERTAAEAAMAIVREVVVALAWYLLAVTVLALVLRLGRAGRLVSAADVVTLPFVRGVVQAGLGIGLTGASVAGVGSTVLVPPPVGAPTAADAALVLSVASGDAVMQRLPAESAPPLLQKLGGAEPTTERTWAVAAGEHFWSIATKVLVDARGRPPAEDELVPYWEQLVEANRDRLADRSNPDLLFPGQQLVVPAPPPAP
jgi:nucleoid-associated protein YgaU